MCGSRKGSRNVAANCRRRALSQPVQLAILKHALFRPEQTASNHVISTEAKKPLYLVFDLPWLSNLNQATGISPLRGTQ